MRLMLSGSLIFTWDTPPSTYQVTYELFQSDSGPVISYSKELKEGSGEGGPTPEHIIDLLYHSLKEKGIFL